MTEHSDLIDAIAHVREAQIKSLVGEKIAAGVAAAEILAECNRGMTALGNRFASGECFLPELMVGGMIMKGLLKELTPLAGPGGAGRSVGTVVMGSVQHDVHDIGKDIVIMMLRGVGFEVVDLGVDAPPERFVDAIRQHRPAIVGMSVLLTTCFKSVAATVEAIRAANLRGGLSIMVGGAAASELLAQNTGCDFYGKTAVDAVQFASRVQGLK
ncbi:MAG: cobalamin-dependent protein [Thermoguttaceae bacterium]|jgi:5-methyltetrahydrofolate--homocysteine methyltransferase